MDEKPNYPYYLYLHTNGSLIMKSVHVVEAVGAEDYFDSPFVVQWWKITSADDLFEVKKAHREYNLRGENA